MHYIVYDYFWTNFSFRTNKKKSNRLGHQFLFAERGKEKDVGKSIT